MVNLQPALDTARPVAARLAGGGVIVIAPVGKPCCYKAGWRSRKEHSVSILAAGRKPTRVRDLLRTTSDPLSQRVSQRETEVRTKLRAPILLFLNVVSTGVEVLNCFLL
jgi:hypothetical protein